MNEQDREAQIAAVATGERVTPATLDEVTVSAQYLQPEGTTLTICVLTLRNGFNVTGESACVDPANFNEEIGREIAHRNARDKIWLLEGYALAERRRTGMEQSDNVLAQPSQNSQAMQADNSWHEKNLRMECLRTAVGLIASGQLPGGSDPLALSREFYTFANETGEEAK